MAQKKKKRITRAQILKRSLIVLAIITLLFSGNIISLINVQLVKNDTFKAYAEKNQLEDKPISAGRGTIYDSNMNILAQSASVWKVYVNPNNFTKFSDKVNNTAVETVSEKLAGIFGLEKEDVRSKIVDHSSQKYIVIKSKVEKAQKDQVSEFLKEFIKYEKETSDGKKNNERVYYSYFIGIETDTKRYYPNGSLASSVIGFTGASDEGRYGLEYAYNNTLTGTDGRLIYSNSAMNINSSVEFESAYDAKQGDSIVLTIDSTIQRYLDDALKQCYTDSNCETCYGIVMDVKSGAVLAMSSQNDYDPNTPSKIINETSQKKIDELTDDAEKKKLEENVRAQQWSNNAVSDVYEPGSVFKVITLSAAIEEEEDLENFFCAGHIKIDDRNYFCHNHSGHGSETLNQGLANSCNPYYITMGQNLGVSRFNKYFEAFGFTEKTGIDLPAEANPVAGVTYHKFDEMTRVNLASSSFGQSFAVSAIQMISAINAVGNGGKLMQPYVVAKTLDSNQNLIKETQPVVKRQVISESTSKRVLEAMVETVKTGTAKNAYVAGYNVAGKTGTSDKLTKPGEYIASFAGIAPANDPKISVIIVVDEPQGATGGGAVAAPVAAEVIENTLTYLNVKRSYNDDEKADLNIAVPNFTDNSVSEARTKAFSEKLNVKVIGSGDKVISQCPSFGQYIPQNGIVALYTEENAQKATAIVPDFTGMTVSQASLEAVNAGINIKITGNALKSAGLLAYRQSVAKETEVEYGSSVTVYFKTGTGITDG
ncbi:MAG: PASTA domain-containing protein [Clostridia bacterium]|nr:PASTA domain-containing protein [Clostridia bacterium]